MALTAYCSKCNKLGHWASDCPDNAGSVTNRRVDNVSTSPDVSTGVDKKERRREYQKEWVRRKREANRVG